LTTDQGIRVPHTDDSLKAGRRGPTLLEDFHLREKITRFDHERIPERVVHARGSAAHGYFQVYESMAEYTRAAFLQEPSRKTPVFVRFSTVVGSRGSADTVRDVRGFATKFYTDEGNFDLVGNNIPVFFIQDGIKFPDLVHAVKPEADHEMPQASSAHDTFWDFVSLVPETLHMVMWVMSDRAIPRSFRMMEGFGVHTFKLVNNQGTARLVKFHWKPILGTHALVWDEAQKIAGRDPDFHRRDLWEAIQTESFPEYELGVQIVEERDELRFGFDLLDATKLLPEELVPVRRIGKMTLDRNPQSFFAETEQVAFDVGNVVPGIDFTNDPLLQARLFSYVDTQLTRLGGPNFAEIPINRPVAPVHNHQQDGFGRQTINTGKANYHPNSVGGGCPFLAPEKAGGYAHHGQRLDGPIVRERSETFQDHYSQATLFVRSLSRTEKTHLIDACKFEVGKVEREEIRQRVVDHFAQIDRELAQEVAGAVGVTAPAAVSPSTRAAGSKATKTKTALERSPALSMFSTVTDTIKTRKVAILAENGVRSPELAVVQKVLREEGATPEIVSSTLGVITGADGRPIKVDKALRTVSSVLYDAVFVPGGAASIAALMAQTDAAPFVQEAFKHYKAIAAASEGVDFIVEACRPVAKSAMRQGAKSAKVASSEEPLVGPGVVTTRDPSSLRDLARRFVTAIAQHRHWDRFDEEHRPGK
jgi:catalase